MEIAQYKTSHFLLNIATIVSRYAPPTLRTVEIFLGHDLDDTEKIKELPWANLDLLSEVPDLKSVLMQFEIPSKSEAEGEQLVEFAAGIKEKVPLLVALGVFHLDIGHGECIVSFAVALFLFGFKGCTLIVCGRGSG